MKIIQFFQKALASILFLGYFPFMPGTLGSALVVFGLWFLQRRTHATFSPELWWIAIFVFTAFSIVVSSRPKEVFHQEDPKQIIVDECVGQLVTFFLLPLTLNTLLLGFLLFRFFDIVKPFPIYKMEELDGGIGITMDDVVAGVCANVSLMGILYVYHIVKTAL